MIYVFIVVSVAINFVYRHGLSNATKELELIYDEASKLRAENSLLRDKIKSLSDSQ